VVKGHLNGRACGRRRNTHVAQRQRHCGHTRRESAKFEFAVWLKEDYAARGRKTHLDTYVERKHRASTRAVDRALGCYSYRLGDTDIPSISILAVARV